jgi:hypothetical protein
MTKVLIMTVNPTMKVIVMGMKTMDTTRKVNMNNSSTIMNKIKINKKMIQITINVMVTKLNKIIELKLRQWQRFGMKIFQKVR